MVRVGPAPLMVRLPAMSRSPLAAWSSPAPAIVKVIVPGGRMIRFRPPLASAAMMADRSEMWPDASLPFLRSTATVSSSVLTRKVERATRGSSTSR